MSPEKRSALMARIKGRNTGPERALAEGIRSFDCLWESHARDLPGCPDFVFRTSRLVVFVDGDFWHGWRFCAWRHKLPEKWEKKIAQNLVRDRRNRAKLRRQGWTVVRIWEHQIERDMAACLSRIKRLLDQPWSHRVAATTRRASPDQREFGRLDTRSVQNSVD
jgi:DNA mismatch endonuclease (patch repair protein)